MYENRSLIPDWDTIRLVLAIDRYGGVSGAARFLGVTHATISRRLARAEEAAGLKFFERLPAGLRLTEPGNKIIAHGKTIEPITNRLERELMSHEAGLSGPVRLTIPPLMLTEELSADLAEFSELHPEVMIEFVGNNEPLNLHQREADIAIRVTSKPPETLWGRKLTNQHAGYYASPLWLEQNARSLQQSSYELPVISFTSWKQAIPNGILQRYPKAKTVAVSDDMISAIQLIKSGFGISRVPRIVGQTTPGLSLIETIEWEPYSPVWILTHPELRRVPRIEAMMGFLATKITARQSDYCLKNQ